MTQKEILEGNRLIAEFVGNTSTLWTKRWFVSDYSVMKYHSSWDWLIPCIGKISNECEEPEELDNLKYALLSNDIKTAWFEVVEFIKWYNDTGGIQQ